MFDLRLKALVPKVDLFREGRREQSRGQGNHTDADDRDDAANEAAYRRYRDDVAEANGGHSNDSPPKRVWDGAECFWLDRMFGGIGKARSDQK